MLPTRRVGCTFGNSVVPSKIAAHATAKLVVRMLPMLQGKSSRSPDRYVDIAEMTDGGISGWTAEQKIFAFTVHVYWEPSTTDTEGLHMSDMRKKKIPDTHEVSGLGER